MPHGRENERPEEIGTVPVDRHRHVGRDLRASKDETVGWRGYGSQRKELIK